MAPMINNITNTLRATPSRQEKLKEACPTLAGTISQTLADPLKDRFSEDDYEFLKFHGIYQSDDRDKRKVAKEYIYMVRGRLPGGIVPPAVYLAFDRLCDQFANRPLRITTRQAFQFHGVTKGRLGQFMKSLNEAMATTLAAGLWGIEHATEAPPPIEGNASDRGEAAPLPRTLREATDRLVASRVAPALLGEAFVDHYARTRDWECRQYDRAVTDWELGRYFEAV